MTTEPFVRFAEAYKELSGIGLTADSNNPHFRNKYASINAYFDLIKPVLLKHRLLLVATSRVTPSNTVICSVCVNTFDGVEVVSSQFTIPQDLPLASLGGWVTYNFRYAMRGLFSLPTEVDLDAPPLSSDSKSTTSKSILSTKR